MVAKGRAARRRRGRPSCSRRSAAADALQRAGARAIRSGDSGSAPSMKRVSITPSAPKWSTSGATPASAAARAFASSARRSMIAAVPSPGMRRTKRPSSSVDRVDAIGQAGEARRAAPSSRAPREKPGIVASRLRALPPRLARSVCWCRLVHAAGTIPASSRRRKRGDSTACASGVTVRSAAEATMAMTAGSHFYQVWSGRKRRHSRPLRPTMRPPTRRWSRGFLRRPRTRGTQRRASPRAPSATSRRSATRAAASAGLRTSCTNTASPPRRGWR